jgi:hypothetical protein
MEPTTRIPMTNEAPLSRGAIGKAKREQYDEQLLADASICPLSFFIHHRFHISKFYLYLIDAKTRRRYSPKKVYN